MNGQPRFDPLEQALRDLAAAVQYPPAPPLAARVQAALALPRRSRGRVWVPRLAITLGVLAIAGILIAASSSRVREAVAERFGLRSVTVTRITATPTAVATTPAVTTTPSPPALPGADLGLGEPIEPGAVVAAVSFSFRPPDPAQFGEPDAAYITREEGVETLALVYANRPGIPAGPAGVSILVSAYRGARPGDLINKGLPPGTRVVELLVNQSRGLWIEGEPHEFALVGPNGRIRFGTERMAGNVLLWERDGVTYRIEAMIPQHEALDISSSMAP